MFCFCKDHCITNYEMNQYKYNELIHKIENTQFIMYPSIQNGPI